MLFVVKSCFHLLHFPIQHQIGNAYCSLFFAAALHGLMEPGFAHIKSVHGIEQAVHIMLHEIGDQEAQLLMNEIDVRLIFSSKQGIFLIKLQVFADELIKYQIFFSFHY